MAKTSGEIEKEFIENLKAATGKDLSGWLSAIKKSGIEKRNDIISWLKKDNPFGHMNASLLAGIYFNDGKPVYGSEEDLLENQFKGKDGIRSLYSDFISFALENFPGATVLPKKTYVSINAKREFAAINIKANELRIGLDLGSMPFNDLVQKSKLTGPMPRISHMIIITDKENLNKQLKDLMAESHKKVS